MKVDLPSLKDAQLSDQTVFLRVDIDVPIVGGVIGDDTRLAAWIPTLRYLVDKGARVVMGGHIGRPDGKDESVSVVPVALWVAEKLGIQKEDIKEGNQGEFTGWHLNEKLFILENLRFFEGEENPSTVSGQEFVKKLASTADLYVNDAFAASHRAHASIVGVPKLLPHYAGFRLEEEYKTLTEVVKNPKLPLVVIIGGAKIETKLPLVEKMYHLADYILVGGKIAQETRALLHVQHEKVPVLSDGKKPELVIADLTFDGKDISEKSTAYFSEIVKGAKTIIWNGTMGLVEDGENDRGTKILAQSIIEAEMYSIVGGGDTVAYLQKIGIADKFSFVSTGGGAMLSLLSGESLPGIEALKT